MRFIKLFLSTHLIFFKQHQHFRAISKKRIETLQKSHIRDANMKKGENNHLYATFQK